MGEVGRRLAGALEACGWTVRAVTRNDGWDAAVDAADPSPRVVAVREEALQQALDRFPDALRPRLVLVQNGFLEAVHGDLGPVGRGLIYFTSKGDFFEVLCPSPFFGPAAEGIAAALPHAGLPVEWLADREAFLRAMIVKGVWNAIVGLPLAVHGVDLATYSSEHRDELERLADESCRAASAEYGVAVEGPEAVRKLDETTGRLGWVRGGAKALEWRNGAIATFGRRHGVATPVNDRLLEAVGFDPDR
jgi:ketopantoate reductase